jgi:hypothetical protein
MAQTLYQMMHDDPQYGLWTVKSYLRNFIILETRRRAAIEEAHAPRKHDKIYSCRYCTRSWRSPNLFNEHMQSTIHNPQMFSCPKHGCLSTFQSLVGMFDHMEQPSHLDIDTCRLRMNLISFFIKKISKSRRINGLEQELRKGEETRESRQVVPKGRARKRGATV